jgi:hypothetical protein
MKLKNVYLHISKKVERRKGRNSKREDKRKEIKQ